MSVYSGDRERQRYNKKMMDFINRFSYYSDNIQESSDLNKGPKTISDLSHCQSEIGCSSFHYLRQKRQPYCNQTYLNRGILTSIARETLVPSQADMHNPLMLKEKYKKEEQGQSKRIVDILVIENMQERQKEQKPEGRRMERTTSMKSYVSSTFKTKPGVKQYKVFVIHFPKEQDSLWSYYVEKLTLKENLLDKTDSSWPIEYEAVVSFPKQTWFHKNVQKYFSNSPQMGQLIQISKGTKDRLNLFESSLAKHLSTVFNDKQSIKEYNCHPEFKRESQLPPGQYKKFERLRNQTYKYFSKINPERELNRYFLDNLVCRYLMVKKYNEEQSLKSLRLYLEWQKQKRKKYQWSDFDRYKALDVFRYLGKDYEGRPILFFRAINFLPDKLDNVKQYFEYNAYLFEIFTQDNMEGYIDNFTIIADYTGFSTKNFQYGPAKQFSETGDKFFPERQYKLILFGVGKFGEWIYTVLKPVLPEFVVRKITIFGNDRQPLKKQIQKYLDLRLIPEDVFEDAKTDEGSSPKKAKIEEA